jgi:hypothetical protein
MLYTQRVNMSGTLSCPRQRRCARIMSERKLLTGMPKRTCASRNRTSAAHLLVAYPAA